MIVYKGYYYFMKANGQIWKKDFQPGHHGSLLGIGGHIPNLICVNKNDERDMQIKSVIHEFAHIGLELDELLYGVDVIPADIDKIEKRIEEVTDEFYNRKPPLLSKIEELLIHAKEPEKMRVYAV